MLCLTTRVLTLSVSARTGSGGVVASLFLKSGSISDKSLALDSVVPLGDGAVLGGDGVVAGSNKVIPGNRMGAEELSLLFFLLFLAATVREAEREELRLRNKLLKNVLEKKIVGKGRKREEREKTVLSAHLPAVRTNLHCLWQFCPKKLRVRLRHVLASLVGSAVFVTKNIT